jgi:hypothetical protein
VLEWIETGCGVPAGGRSADFSGARVLEWIETITRPR